ncbi:MAG: hypothetical protein V7750_08760 [Sneathiella sp.]
MRNLEKILAGTALAVVLTLSGPQLGVAGFDEAVKAYEAGDYKVAYNEWLPLAENDDPAAMRNIGHLYRRGLGVDLDHSKALAWYMRAANMGFDRAQANVGAMYLKGEGVRQDYVKASEWFTKAARKGHTISQFNLGLLYEHGKGVERSNSKALAWYNLAAKAGHPQALNKLSMLIASDPSLKEEKVATKSVAETVKPKPVTVVEKNEVPKVTKPVVVAKPAAETIEAAIVPLKAAEPIVKSDTAKAPTKKKWDPFAGSANNLASAESTAPKGEPTVFNQKTAEKVAEKPVLAAKPEVITEPTVVVEPVKSVTKVIVAPKTESLVPEKTSPVSVAEKSVEPATKVSPEKNTPQKETEAVKKEQGFFAALTSLLVETPKEAPEKKSEPIEPVVKNVNAPSATVASTAPVTAIKPAAPTRTVNITGSGLTLAEQMEMAELSFTLEEYQQALGIWAPLAQRGNAEAQYNLGVMFEGGYAVPVDRVRAFYWWQKAKRNGSQKAATSLAQLEKTLTYLEKRQLQRSN